MITSAFLQHPPAVLFTLCACFSTAMNDSYYLAICVNNSSFTALCFVFQEFLEKTGK